jgi:hypothetical protein
MAGTSSAVAGFPGITSSIDTHTDSGYVVIVMAKRDTGSLGRVSSGRRVRSGSRGRSTDAWQ